MTSLTPNGAQTVLYFACLTGILLLFLLWAEWRAERFGQAVFKAMASTSFVGCALAAQALGSRYGRWVLLALALCWFGDVFLLSREKGPFKAGLVSFLLAHLAFSTAFLSLGVEWKAVAIVALVVGVVGAGIVSWLIPHVASGMRIPVAAYLVVISAMVALGSGAASVLGAPVLLIAPLAFYLSDLAVARDRFVSRSFFNRLWGLPLYYGAQILFAVSPTLLV